MSHANKKSVLVVVRRTPYGSSLARTALETALASATFDQKIGLLFMGDGVLQLLPEQDSSAIGVRNIAKLIDSFPLYGLDQLFADETALCQYGLGPQDLPQNLQQLNDDGMRQLLVRYDHILGF